ncbi:hypothetical protein BC829DRAFT_399388 [Chytridium lagenaria]|nr:hypothetical protein BC829DRAFT_399388 [Chytridium lagenaria]
MDDTLNVLTFCKMFVNQSLVWKLEQEQLMTEGAGQKPGMIHRTSVFRKSIFFAEWDVSGDAIAVTPKFQMKTRISEFRCLSIMFIKLNFPYDPQKAQTIFVKVDEILAECAATFNIDDKGQTVLSIFGWNNPRNPCVTTNEILYSTLGNSLRSEASILGDVVNLAARIMCLSADQISDDEAVVVLCDNTTREATSDVFPAKMMGTFKFKGMKEEVKVWKVDAGQHERKKKESEYISQSQSFLVGYTEEREQVRFLLFGGSHCSFGCA